jgi:hypothetical protein
MHSCHSAENQSWQDLLNLLSMFGIQLKREGHLLDEGLNGCRRQALIR